MKEVLLILSVVCFSLIAVHISTAEIDLETGGRYMVVRRG